jgi:hypothetical protein
MRPFQRGHRAQGRPSDGAQGRPGAFLRAIASHLCRASAMERLIDPVIADLESEHAEMLRRGHVWRSRWVRLAGSFAFWKVIGLYSIERTMPLAQEWAAADDHALGRTFRFSASWMVFAVGCLVWVPIQHHLRRVSVGDAAWMTLYLIPQAITVAIPFALAIGTLCGLRGRSVSIHTQRSLVVFAALLSVVMFIVLGWILPDANQAFRVLIAHRMMLPALGVNGQVPRGMNELTLGQLAAGHHWFQFHGRCALSVATLVLALFACTISRRMHGSWKSIAAGVVAVGAYVWLLMTLRGSGASTLDAWTPNLILALLTVFMVRLSPRHDPHILTSTHP